jgi:Holliday junction DNA helicase RuvA
VARQEDPRALARDGLIELGYGPQEADAMLDGASGERAEELIADALRVARR